MKLENQVCTFEQAKQLFELGIVQESLYYFAVNQTLKRVEGKRRDRYGFKTYHYVRDEWNEPYTELCNKRTVGCYATTSELGNIVCCHKILEVYSAFNVCELGNMISYHSLPFSFVRGNTNQLWWADEAYSWQNEPLATEAEARANMLIERLKNGDEDADYCNKMLLEDYL